MRLQLKSPAARQSRQAGTKCRPGAMSGPEKCHTGRALLAAALALPSIQAAHAESVPERGVIAYKHLDYDDSQPPIDRVSVDADSLMVMAPFQEKWSITGIVTTDTISGASPAWHTSPISMTQMDDKRDAQDLRLTRYFGLGSLTVGASHSKESDYESKALSLLGSISTEDKNTTFNIGIGRSSDRIDPTNKPTLHEKKYTTDLMLGVTQVLTPKDIAQLNVTHGSGHGYFTDPYKFLDNRPRDKRQTAILARWNHYVEHWDGVSQLSYRYYQDSFGIRAHTLTAEYTQKLTEKWSLTPSLRLYTQSAADFYVESTAPPLPVLPPGYVPGVTIMSYDQRLAAFGARTLGIKLSYQPNKDWIIDLKYEDYVQKTDWRLFGDGSQNLDSFCARSIQVGLARYF